MPRIIVTGATGFIGSHALSPLLEAGFSVHATTRRLIPGETRDITWHQVDLLDPTSSLGFLSFIKATHLLHLAWDVTPGRYTTSPQNIHWVEASLRVLRTFVQAGGQRAVMAGTCAEYDWAEAAGPLTEYSTPLAPSTLYGTSKHALEQIFAAFARQTGLSGAWGRVFFVYGPGEHPDRLVPSVIRSLLRNEVARTSSGHQRRDYLHVQDVASAFATLVASDVDGPVNIGSGRPVSVREIITTIAKLAGREDLLQLGYLPTPANEPECITAAVRRLTDEVGWRQTRDLVSGLAATIEWWKATEASPNRAQIPSIDLLDSALPVE